MPSNKPGPIVPRDTRFLTSITGRIKLIYRLMMDKRVNMVLKALPLASLVYFIVPDLMPGPIDDAVMIWLSTYLFVELCPPEVVDEHMKDINRVITGEYRDVEPNTQDVDIIEGEVIDVEDKEEK